MDDDSDDPVMALLATQRAVLAAIENLASQVEAMQGTLAQLVASSAGAAAGKAVHVPTLGERFRAASIEDAKRYPELMNALSQSLVADAIANTLHKGDPDGAARELARAREWIADQLDRGRVFEKGKTQTTDKGKIVVIEPIHEEMFGGRVKAQRPDRERTR